MYKIKERLMAMEEALGSEKNVEDDVIKFTYKGCNGSFTMVGDCMAIEYDGLWGFADANGNFVTPPQYDDVILPMQQTSPKAKIVGVRSGPKWAVADLCGRLLTEFKYDAISEIINGYASVMIDCKWGFVNSEGKEICEIKYDDSFYFHNGKVKVFLGNEEFYIDSDGNRVE